MCVDSECVLPTGQRIGIRGCAGIRERGNCQISAARSGRPIEIVVGRRQTARDYRNYSLIIWRSRVVINVVVMLGLRACTDIWSACGQECTIAAAWEHASIVIKRISGIQRLATRPNIGVPKRRSSPNDVEDVVVNGIRITYGTTASIAQSARREQSIDLYVVVAQGMISIWIKLIPERLITIVDPVVLVDIRVAVVRENARHICGVSAACRLNAMDLVVVDPSAGAVLQENSGDVV